VGAALEVVTVRHQGGQFVAARHNSAACLLNNSKNLPSRGMKRLNIATSTGKWIEWFMVWGYGRANSNPSSLGQIVTMPQVLSEKKGGHPAMRGSRTAMGLAPS
jgi:hypothetical protein